MPWPLWSVLQVLPRGLRNWLYDRVALNRYTLFGIHDVCIAPNPDHARRFLDNTK